jgi:hypothetical protein
VLALLRSLGPSPPKDLSGTPKSNFQSSLWPAGFADLAPRRSAPTWLATSEAQPGLCGFGPGPASLLPIASGTALPSLTLQPRESAAPGPARPLLSQPLGARRCQMSDAEMDWDTSRYWPHIWQEAMLAVVSGECHVQRDSDVICYACPSHKEAVEGCLDCYACQYSSSQLLRSRLPLNDRVHIRRMLLAATRLLRSYGEPVDHSHVSHMLCQTLNDGMQFVPWYVAKALFDSGHIGRPIPARPTSSSGSTSSSSSSS